MIAADSALACHGCSTRVLLVNNNKETPHNARTIALYFGIEHLSNPNSSWVAVAGIFFIGLFFAYGYLRTKQLWLPIGIHVGWNFFENAVFGFPVSGFDRPGLFRITVSGPDLWTGGAFGPEAGLVMLPICLLGVILVNIYTKRHKVL